MQVFSEKMILFFSTNPLLQFQFLTHHKYYYCTHDGYSLNRALLIPE